MLGLAFDSECGIPRTGGTLRLARTSDPQSIDPAVCYITEELLLTRLVFQGLVDYNEQSRVFAKQAAEWTISPDRKTYTFQLRPGMRFANGREVEASDYVYSLERVLDPRTQSPGESFYHGIVGAVEFQQGKARSVSGLRARKKDVLEIELLEPDFTFEFKLGLTFACVVPREAIEAEGGRFWSHAYGSGPYRLTQWKRGISMVFERRPAENLPGEGYFDHIEVMLGGDRALHTLMLERGELDCVYYPQLSDTVRLKRDLRLNGLVRTIPIVNTEFLYLNTEIAPFNQPEVRRAISQAIDKNHLVRLTAHTSQEARSILPPLLPGFNANAVGWDFDPVAARKRLEESGFPDGFRFDLWYCEEDPTWGRMVVAIESDLRAIGVHANLKKVTLASLLTAMQTRKAVPSAYLGWSQDYPDPGDYLDVLFNGGNLQDFGGNNYSYYNNPKVNQGLAEADKIAIPSERYRSYQNIENQILYDAPVVPLTHPSLRLLVAPRVEGCRGHPVWQIQFEHWWANDLPRN